MEHFPTGNGTARTGPPHGYLPIEEHGIVGDLRTVALIGTDGTVDWYCPARFDAPSLFGALLDKNKGGYFSLTARTSYAKPKQLYLPDTNILLTRFQGKDAVGEVIDFMVPETRPDRRARDLLVRQARAVRGTVTFELACHPAFDYGRLGHEVQIIQGVGAVFTSPLGRAVLRTNVSLKAEDGGVAATFTLAEGESADFHLEWNGDVRPITGGETDELFTRTQDFWQGWLAQSRYTGRWREMVQRSALALKLLVYHPTGALVAAPTTSLPEEPGGTQELGLPLRLAAGRLVHRLQPHAARLPRGGGELHGLAAQALRDGHGGTRRHDHVHRRRQRPPARRRRSTTWRATTARSRSGSATARSASGSWTSTARSWTRCTSTTRRSRSPTTCGPVCPSASTGSAGTGPSRTRASGRSAARGSASPTPP